MKKFLEDLRQELIKKHMTATEIADILADHEEMIRTALAEGLPEEQIRTRFGNPEKLAADLAESPKPEEERKPIEGFQLWKSFSISTDQINVKIQMTAEDLSIQPSADGQIRVYYQGKPDLEKYILSFEAGELLFKASRDKIWSHGIRLFSHEPTFMVELPSTVAIHEFTLSTVSGDVQYSSISAQRFNLSTVSGDVVLTGGQFGPSKWNTVSGDMSISGSVFATVNSSQVSGDLVVTNVLIEDGLTLDTVSGDTKIDHSSCEECTLVTVSGDIIATEFYPKRVSLRSLSGDINIKNSEPGKIEVLKKSSMSGDIHING